MPYLSGVLTGIVLTILTVFLIDNIGPESDTLDIVNWDYVGSALSSSVETVGAEVRQEVHEATAPDEQGGMRKGREGMGQRWEDVRRKAMSC